MSGLILPGETGRRRAAEPTVPVEIADAVERWAREWGRHARITHLMHTDPPTPQVRLSPRYGDPDLKLVSEGKMPAEEAEEVVHLWEYDPEKGYVGVPLAELGVRGVVEWLQRGNTESGSGEFDSLQDALDHVREQQKRETRKLKQELRDDVRRLAGEVGPHMRGVPQIQGENFNPEDET